MDTSLQPKQLEGTVIANFQPTSGKVQDINNHQTDGTYGNLLNGTSRAFPPRKF